MWPEVPFLVFHCPTLCIHKHRSSSRGGGVWEMGLHAPSYGNYVLFRVTCSWFGQWHLRGKHLTLNDWFGGEHWILFPENLNVSQHEFTVPLGTSQICYIEKQMGQTGGKRPWDSIKKPQATFNCTVWSRATAINISWVMMNCYTFDVIVFPMLPAHGSLW